MIESLNLLLLLFILTAGIAAVCVPELISATFLLGAFSFFYAMLLSLLEAADVAFTEAVVGVGVSTIFLFLTLFQTEHKVKSRPFPYRPWLVLGLAAGAVYLFMIGSVDLPWFGDPNSPANSYLSPDYLLHTLKETGTPNAVTAIVADYRSFDTLIEGAVIFVAAISCLVITRMRHD